MKFTKQDLLTMLIGLFLFSSCKDANTIGLAPDDSAITGDLYENTTLTSRTQEDDAVSASTLLRYPIGTMHDPVFGLTQAGTAMTVNIPSVNYRFGANAVVDSAVLVLPYNSQFYGDSTQTYTFSVKQLATDLTLQTKFLSSTNWGAGATDIISPSYIGGKQFPNTKFKVTNIVTGAADTLATVAPQLRIKLDVAKIQQRIVNLDTNVYTRNDLFIAKFNGLYVDVKTATGAGATAFFNFSSTDADLGAKLQIYYKKDGLSPATRDTVSATFPINNVASPVVAYVKHEYTTAIKTQLNDQSNTQYPNTYVQGLTGLRNKISFDFSDFKTLLAGAKVSINKAELVIDVTPEEDTYFKSAPRLRLYRYNAAGFPVNVPDNDVSIQNQYTGDARAVSPELFGGYFDSVNRRYIFTVTAYVQDLVDGRTKDYGTFISPTPLTEFTVSPFASSAERSILVAPKKDAPAGTKRMKLNIFYSKLK